MPIGRLDTGPAGTAEVSARRHGHSEDEGQFVGVQLDDSVFHHAIDYTRVGPGKLRFVVIEAVMTQNRSTIAS